MLSAYLDPSCHCKQSVPHRNLEVTDDGEGSLWSFSNGNKKNNLSETIFMFIILFKSITILVFLANNGSMVGNLKKFKFLNKLSWWMMLNYFVVDQLF